MTDTPDALAALQMQRHRKKKCLSLSFFTLPLLVSAQQTFFYDKGRIISSCTSLTFYKLGNTKMLQESESSNYTVEVGPLA